MGKYRYAKNKHYCHVPFSSHIKVMPYFFPWKDGNSHRRKIILYDIWHKHALRYDLWLLFMLYDKLMNTTIIKHHKENACINNYDSILHKVVKVILTIPLVKDIFVQIANSRINTWKVNAQISLSSFTMFTFGFYLLMLTGWSVHTLLAYIWFLVNRIDRCRIYFIGVSMTYTFPFHLQVRTILDPMERNDSISSRLGKNSWSH